MQTQQAEVSQLPSTQSIPNHFSQRQVGQASIMDCPVAFLIGCRLQVWFLRQDEEHPLLEVKLCIQSLKQSCNGSEIKLDIVQC